jgi:protein TonB
MGGTVKVLNSLVCAIVLVACASISSAQQRTIRPLPSPPLDIPVRVGGDISPPLKIVDVEPVYPEAARASRLTGAVLVEFTIDTRGAVIEAHVVRSTPMFDAAALAAVKQWKFKPTVLRGVRFSVMARETVGFWPDPER